MSNFVNSIKFFAPYTIVSTLIFCGLYFTGLYQIFGTVEGYGWSNSVLLNRFFEFIGYFPPKYLYPYIFGVFYFVISVPFQEWVFRVVPKIFITQKWVYIWLTSIIFTLCHIYYLQPFGLVMVFGMGVLTGLDYWNNRNFWTICAFHGITASMAFTLNLA